jgi:predicted PurR-regulated permease PerM
MSAPTASPPDPAVPEPTGGGEPSGSAPRTAPPATSSGRVTAQLDGGDASRPLRGGPPGDGWRLRTLVSQWGFPLFVLAIVVVGRSVLLPFVFAALIAYILAPLVRRMTERADGSRRMPRGLAIILCYLAFLASVAGFGMLIVPHLARDVARLGSETPALYDRVDHELVPRLARYLEKRFPQLAAPPPAPASDPAVAAAAAGLPPGTALTVTPLQDGSFAVRLAPSGIEVRPDASGGYRLLPAAAPPAPQTLEERLREWVRRSVAGLQSQLDDAVRLGRAVVAGVVQGVFTFFLVLMIGAFMLIDMEKVHAFLRSLFPPNVRGDYDVIIAGIDRGLSGVIRGQLLICLVNGVLTYVGLLIFDVKYALVLAVVAAVMSLIPIFGSILSTIPIVLAALVSGDSGVDVVRAVGAVLWIVGIHFVEANFLNPKIIGSSAKIHPVVVIFALILGERSYGLVGALLAVPVASMIQVVFVFLYKKTWKKDPGVTGPIRVTSPPR